MKIAPTIAKEIAALARASTIPTVTLRANGEEIGAEKRDAMLRACAAGEYVELELDISPAYEQKPGEQNRNFVRFRDGIMMALGRSGVGKPFLRDHEQGDALARAGTITASRTEKRGEGDYAIHQTVKLTAPWAVELALRGLLSTVSIGWNPSGMVQCSVCSMNWYRCSHMPGQMYQREDGSEEMTVCERIYTSAELVETSAVSVPAVPSAQIDAIRAALSAHNSGEFPPRETDNMNPQIVALLGLAATAGDSEVIKAVESLASAKKLIEQQRDELATRLAAANAKLAGYEQVLATQAADKFIEDGVKAGKIIPGSQHEQSLRAYYGKDAEGAKALLAGSPVITPVGLPRQTGATPPAESPANAIDAAITAAGGDPAKVRAQLRADGLSEASIEKQLAAMVSRKGA